MTMADGRGLPEVPEVLEGHVRVNDCDLFYQRLGSGPSIVFVHGGMVLDGSNFLPHVAPLAEDFTLIIYDQCGRGRSTEREGFDLSKVTIMNDVDDLDGLREALGFDTWTVAGHSWGGVMAGLYAWKYPDSIDKLIMISPVGSHYPAWQKPWILNTLDMLPEANRAEFDNVLKDRELKKRDPQEFFTRYFTSIHPAWFADQSWANRIPLHKVRAKTGGVVWDSLRGYDFRDRFAEIKVDTLIMHGTKDAIPLSSSKEIHGLIKGSKLAIFENVGHYPTIEARERFAKVVRDFLR
jgi:proline iminopeptidase